MQAFHGACRLGCLAFVTAVADISVCHAQPAPVAALPPASIAALQQSLAAPVAAHQAPGVMLLVAQGGKTLFAGAAGRAEPPPAPPLEADMIFWVASMSKPVTAVAVLMLAEAGKLHLDDPASKYIPALGKLIVKNGAASVPAARAVTLRDLLTHTSGIASAMSPPPPGAPGPPPGAEGPPPGGMIAPDVTGQDTLASWVPKLAGLPLEHQPGAAWAYSPGAGFDVLSRVVEVASGQDFRDFVTTRIFAPLGMRDTTYGMPHAAGDRVLRPMARFADDPRVVGTRYTSGAAGLFTTMADYAKFASMLAEGGLAPDGHRLLSAHGVADMSANHVGHLFAGVLGRPHAPGEGFGYGVAIVLDPVASGIHLPAGSFGWDGAGGSRFWVSPSQHRVLIEYANPKAQPLLEAKVEAVLH